jgi:hypothetical protein
MVASESSLTAMEYILLSRMIHWICEFRKGGNIIPMMFLRLQIRKVPSRFSSLKSRDLLMLPNLVLRVGRRYSRL